MGTTNGFLRPPCIGGLVNELAVLFLLPGPSSTSCVGLWQWGLRGFNGLQRNLQNEIRILCCGMYFKVSGFSARAP